MTSVPGPVPDVPSQAPKWTSVFDHGGTERLALLVDLFTQFGGGTFPDFTGVGSPEGAVVGAVGQTYIDTVGDDLWWKESGGGADTGWINLSGGGGGGGAAPAFHFTDLTGWGTGNGTLAQGGGVISLQATTANSTRDQSDNNGMAILSIVAKFFMDGTTAGEAGQAIVLNWSAITGFMFSGVQFDVLFSAPVALWRGKIGGITATGIIRADGQVCDTAGQPILDGLIPNDEINFSVSMLMVVD